ncbi:hypothetical protein D9M72_530280 [compost metagenome]
MVQADGQHMPVVGELRKPCDQCRRAAQVEHMRRGAANERIDGGLLRVCALVREVDALQRERHLGLHDLHRHAVVLDEVRAQDRVARNDRLERAFQRIGVERAGQPEHTRQVVGREPGLELLQEAQLLLRIRQRHRLAVVHGAGDLVHGDAHAASPTDSSARSRCRCVCASCSSAAASALASRSTAASAAGVG